MKDRFPGAGESFVNCPEGNWVGDGELKLRVAGESRQGTARARPVDPTTRRGGWEVTAFHAAFFKNRFKDCETAGLPRRPTRLRPTELYTDGLSCDDARRSAADVSGMLVYAFDRLR